jgi:hypothetical protein
MTVVYPVYLDRLVNAMDFSDWVVHCTLSIWRALAQLDAGDHVPVQRDASGRPELAFVAHSMGSYVASFVAEIAADTRLIPAPRVLAFMDAAGHDYKDIVGVDTTKLAGIDPSTDVILLSSEVDLLDAAGRPASNTQLAVADLIEHLPVTCDHLSAWVVASDAEGDSRLVSDHLDGPQTHHVFDAIDWWGYWPQITAHLQYAFWGTYASFTHAGGLYSGSWLDEHGNHLRDIARKRPHPVHPVGYGCP